MKSSVPRVLPIMVAACAMRPGLEPAALTPRQAVMAAADAAPGGVPGTFALTVRSEGTQDGRYYLNSEADYRDQRNLSVDIDPGAAAALSVRYGQDPLSYFAGKPIIVSGTAQRVKISFISDGRLSDKYYFQTHVRVAYPDQIRLLH